MSGTACSPNSAAHTMIPNGHHHNQASVTSSTRSSSSNNKCCGFQMPLHYPRLKKADYENMPECQLDCLLREYGLPAVGDLNQKRKFAMGAFLWPSQY